MASLGQELKRERELRGISLRDISDSTRISLKFLEAIEDDRLEAIPGEFFIRAILRSYARCIGIDEHQVLNRYREVHSFREQLGYAQSLKKASQKSSPRFFCRRTIWIIALAGGILGLGFVLLDIFVLSPRGKPPVSAPTVQRASSLEIPKRQAPLEPLPVAEEVQGLHLQMTFLEETWIHAYADGKSVWDGIKKKGEALSIEAEREVRLNIGNAGGTDLVINGQRARPLGPSGAVRLDVRITPENYVDFLAPEQEKEG